MISPQNPPDSTPKVRDAVGGQGAPVRQPGGLDALFAPRAIAVVGASASPGKLGSAMAHSLRTFDGPVVLVNDRRPAPGRGVYPSVAAAVDATGSPVDLAIFCVPAPATPGAVAEAAAAGVRAALVCAGGFAEAGGPGLAIQAALAGVVADSGLRLLGPNTSGFLAPGRNLVASFVPGAGEIGPGAVSVVASSGGMLHALGFLLAAAGLGLHLGVGIGNGLDVTGADVVDHLATGASAGPVALHVEGLADGQGRRLAEAVARLAERDPVVALVVGRSDVGDLARSHTGALTPSWRTTRAALRQAGAVLVDDERELVDAVAALARGRIRPGPAPGVGLVAGQAGPAVLLADGLRSAGVAVPPLAGPTVARLGELLPPITHQRNPVDTGRPGDTFPQVLAAVSADPGVDLLAVYALLEPSAFDLVGAIRAALGAIDTAPDSAGGIPLCVSTEKIGMNAQRRAGAGGARAPGAFPTVVGLGGPPADVVDARRDLAAIGVTAYDGVAGAVAGVRALVDDAGGRARRSGRGDPVRLVIPEGFSVLHNGGPVDEDEGKRLLSDLGVRTPARLACSNRAEAASALRLLRPPVAVKMLEPVVAHKSRVGGVHLGVTGAEDLDRALDALDAAGAVRYLVEEMAPAGLDLIAGARRDPVFGPVVVLGLGGEAAEALDRVAVRLAPVSEVEAAEMLDELPGGTVGRGTVGRGTVGLDAVDATAVARIVAQLGGLLDGLSAFGEVEINPLRVTPGGGLVALDVVVSLTRQHADQGHHTCDHAPDHTEPLAAANEIRGGC